MYWDAAKVEQQLPSGSCHPAAIFTAQHPPVGLQVCVPRGAGGGRAGGGRLPAPRASGSCGLWQRRLVGGGHKGKLEGVCCLLGRLEGHSSSGAVSALLHLASQPHMLLLGRSLACLSCLLWCGGRPAAACMMRCPLPLTLASLASNWLQEQAAALYRLNMEQYASLKGQLLAATAVGLRCRMYAWLEGSAVVCGTAACNPMHLVANHCRCCCRDQDHPGSCSSLTAC